MKKGMEASNLDEEFEGLQINSDTDAEILSFAQCPICGLMVMVMVMVMVMTIHCGFVGTVTTCSMIFYVLWLLRIVYLMNTFVKIACNIRQQIMHTLH